MSDLEDIRRKLGYADISEFPKDDLLHELHGGERVIVPAPSKRHEVIAEAIFSRMEATVAAGGLGRVFRPPMLVKLSEFDVLQPDAFFVATNRLDLLDGGTLEGAPDLVVEVMADWNGRRNDTVVKHHLYERFGVREYWIVDPVMRSARVDRLVRGALRTLSEPTEEAKGVLASPLLPGLEVHLEGLFPRPRGPSRGTF